MSGLEVLGVAASIIQVADVGLRLSNTIYTYMKSVSSADKRLDRIARHVRLTSQVVSDIGGLFTQQQTASFVSQNATQTAAETARECKEIFDDLEEVICRSKTKWRFPWKEHELELLGAQLEKLKSVLSLLMNVLMHGRMLKQEQAAPEREKIAGLIRARDEATTKYEELKRIYENTILGVQTTTINVNQHAGVSRFCHPGAATPRVTSQGEICKDVNFQGEKMMNAFVSLAVTEPSKFPLEDNVPSGQDGHDHLSKSTITLSSETVKSYPIEDTSLLPPRTLLTTLNLDHCIHHIKGLLREIEAVQQALSEQRSTYDNNPELQRVSALYQNSRSFFDYQIRRLGNLQVQDRCGMQTPHDAMLPQQPQEYDPNYSLPQQVQDIYRDGKLQQQPHPEQKAESGKRMSKSRSIFTPIDENGPIISQHWAFSTSSEEAARKGTAISATPIVYPQSTDVEAASRPVNWRRPKLSIMIPEESDTESVTSDAFSQSSSNAANARRNEQGEDNPSVSGVVLPPLSPLVAPLLSAGEAGPPNPFPRPHDPVQVFLVNDDELYRTLPNAFTNDDLLPSPSDFYPNWNFTGDGHTLPSPLNYTTPDMETGPNFLREDPRAILDSSLANTTPSSPQSSTHQRQSKDSEARPAEEFVPAKTMPAYNFNDHSRSTSSVSCASLLDFGMTAGHPFNWDFQLGSGADMLGPIVVHEKSNDHHGIVNDIDIDPVDQLLEEWTTA